MYTWFPGLIWVSGAPWSAYYFYDHYLYTGDRKFLFRVPGRAMRRAPEFRCHPRPGWV